MELRTSKYTQTAADAAADSDEGTDTDTDITQVLEQTQHPAEGTDTWLTPVLGIRGIQIR